MYTHIHIKKKIYIYIYAHLYRYRYRHIDIYREEATPATRQMPLRSSPFPRPARRSRS